uniref:Uncharacterized protein n=1 Tax=viral metagenome TaxID=1070528 RepID=A0A6M3L8L8_9ZZZZ
MKIIIDTDQWDKRGVKAVKDVIESVQKLYPNADPSEILWGLAHACAGAFMDEWTSVYLPGLAKSNGWKRR